MIDLSNVIALALGSDDVLQIQDAIGTVLWQKIIYYNVNISAGSNGTVSVNGVSGDYSQSVPSGTVLTIEGTGNTGYDFDQWSDGNTDNPRTITVTGDLTLTAAFESAAPLPNYFYVEDRSGSDNTLSIVKSDGSAPTIEVFCSTDKINWVSMGTTSTTSIKATVPANGKLFIKANTNAWCNSTANSNKISVTSIHRVGGNIMSLLYGDYFEGQTTFPSGSTYTFYSLFYANNRLINAGDLILPATTLADYCYSSMFSECSSLTTAPATLPATTLASNCYEEMFYGCESLTTAPALPATTLATGCYSYMFQECTALTTAPVLPARTLAIRCYRYMFYGCTSLTTAPELQASTLTQSCYNNMFRKCTNLNSVTTNAHDISASQCLSQWLNGVSATGDFYNLGGITYPRGASGIPTGWTEHKATINVTIINTDGYTGATYQIDSETAQPVNVTGNTAFTVPATATTLTVNRNGKGDTIFTGVSGLTEDNNWTTAIPVQDMSSNVTIEFMSLM